jgi:hypothetical protein
MKITHLLLPAAALAAASCLPGAPGSKDVACRPLGASAPAKPNPAFHGTVFTIVMENESRSNVLGNANAPYINSLASKYTVAKGYQDALVHPSEPNYIWMVAGENFGIKDDNGPSSHMVSSTSHLADQLDRAGISWRGYMESMGTPCNPNDAYPYLPKHNPFVFFSDLLGTESCRQHVVDYTELDKDLASGNVPRYVFITPNMVSDMHDSDVATGDAWLAREVPKILASPAFQNGGVLFLTWDEGVTNKDDPPMIVISPLAKPGYASDVPYDTSSYLKTVQTLLGVELLPCDEAPDAVNTMDDLFTVPLTS